MSYANPKIPKLAASFTMGVGVKPRDGLWEDWLS